MLSDIQPLEGTFDLRYSAMPDTVLQLMQAFGKQISRKVKSIHKACKYIMNMTILSIFMILMGNSVSYPIRTYFFSGSCILVQGLE